MTAVTFVAIAMGPAEARGVRYTGTNGAVCSDMSDAGSGIWRCPGPAGWIVETADEGNMASISIQQPGRRDHLVYEWRAAGKVLGDLIEWWVDREEPQAAIVRIWRRVVRRDGTEMVKEQLIVLRRSADKFCVTAAVDGRRADANSRARTAAACTPAPACFTETIASGGIP